ncbi:MAG: hypothetical protein Kow0037_30160 [Calditrichia bacterium]
MDKFFKISMCIFLTLVLVALSAVAGDNNVISKKSQVTFTGRLHAQAQSSNVEAAESMNKTFSIRRARLTASWKNLNGTLKAKVQYDLAEGGAKLKDGFVEVVTGSALAFKIGQFKKPFSLWEQTSTTKLMVIERGNKVLGSSWKGSNDIIIKDGLYAGRDIGFMVHGKSNKLTYYLGVFNGNGYHKKTDSDNGKLVGGRLVFQAAKDLAIGASFSNRRVSEYNSFVDTTKNGTGANFQAFEADVEYGIKNKVSKSGPWVQAEYVFGSNPHYSDEAKFMGLILSGSYNFKMKKEDGLIYSVRPVVRVDYNQRNTDDDDTKVMMITPGVDFFFDEYNRIQINMEIVKPQMSGADTEIGFRVQFQAHI